jgi:imidazolonepropionase-like amidohydrolase
MSMLIIRAGAFVVPTLAVSELLRETPLGLPAPAIEKLSAIGDRASEAVEHCRAAGVRLGFGTDLFGPLRDRQCEEFRIRGRLQPGLEVLRSATSVNAELLGLAGEIGTVAVGAAADLIAVRGDPVADPAVLAGMATNLMLVVRGGRVVLDRTGGKGK